MTLNKNGKVIFATHEEKIDQPRQVPPLNYHKTLNPPHFCPPTKISEKIPPLTCPV